MGTLEDRLHQDMITAMKARDTVLTTTLRMGIGALKNEKVAGKQARELSEAEIHTICQGLIQLRQRTGLEIGSCAEDMDLSRYGIAHNRCVDDDLLAKVYPNDEALMNFIGRTPVEQNDLFADEFLITHIVGMHTDRHIAEQGFGTRGGDGDAAPGFGIAVFVGEERHIGIGYTRLPCGSCARDGVLLFNHGFPLIR